MITQIAEAALEPFKGNVKVICASSLTNGDRVAGECQGFAYVHRVNAGNGDKNNVITRIIKLLMVSIGFSWHAIRVVKKSDVIFFVTNPAFIIVPFALLHKIRKVKMCLLVYDIFPENLSAAGLLSEKSIKYRIMKKIFDWSYKQFNELIAIGTDMKTVLERKGVDAKKILVIENWSDSQNICPSERDNNLYLKKFNIVAKRTFLFAGNIGRVQGIPCLIDAIKKAALKHSAFVFVGDGAMQGAVMQLAASVDNVFCTGVLDKSRQNEFLGAGDVAIITLGEGMFGLGVPSKSYFYMAAGKPLLFVGDERSEIAGMIKKYKIGWICPAGCDHELAAMLKSIEEIPAETITDMGRRAREVLCEHYSREVKMRQYQSLFQEFALGGINKSNIGKSI
ncbi:MAG: glycosyltransferase family 4 protein [Victivallaceae bacterium]|nr:glycosyltransferase family 4 protein [Victivallaceae bacterium]